MTHKWTCLECGKEFGIGEWTCADGVSNHRVEEKQYRCTDAPSDSSLRDGRTTVCNIPPGKRVMKDGEVRYEGESSIEFIRGRFATSNPEQQYWLDIKPVYNATEDEWKAAWLTTSQKQELRDIDLTAREQRLENDRNELLSQTQAKVKREPVAAR